jgi:hypothetical protein
VGDLAGDVLQVMGPRTADDDGVIQREVTGREVANRALEPQRGSGRRRPFSIIGPDAPGRVRCDPVQRARASSPSGLLHATFLSCTGWSCARQVGNSVRFLILDFFSCLRSRTLANPIKTLEAQAGH